MGHVPHLRCFWVFYIPRAQRLRAGLKREAPMALEESNRLNPTPKPRSREGQEARGRRAVRARHP